MHWAKDLCCRITSKNTTKQLCDYDFICSKTFGNPRIMAHASNAEGLWVLGQPGLHIKFSVILNCIIKPCFKTKTKQSKTQNQNIP